MNEIIACPSCQRRVTVPSEYFGKQVQCPQCKTTFLAEDPSAAAYQAGKPLGFAEPSAPPPISQDAWDEPPPSPRGRRRFDDDYDNDIGLRRSTMPHRGAAVLTLGILSIVIPFCNPILGPIAWVMGHADLKQIRAGYMDPTGEGMTQAGMIIGMVMTILSAVVLAFYCFILMVAGAAHGL
jgi:hypothetical protein